MKHFLFTSLFTFFVFISTTGQDLIMTGIIDGPLSGGTPKAIEFVALQDIPDLSRYGIGSASNGGAVMGKNLHFLLLKLLQKVHLFMFRERKQSLIHGLVLNQIMYIAWPFLMAMMRLKFFLMVRFTMFTEM